MTDNTSKGRIWDFITRFSLPIILIGFTLFGLGCKLAISLNKSLDSDNVNPGIMSMEIWKHCNYLLYDFYLPSNCTHIFSEVVPFYLLPEILTNFNPVAFRCIGFVLFALIILVYAYIVYLATNSWIKSLVFSALMANLTPVSYINYSTPVNHNGVIFFIGLLLVIAFSKRVGDNIKLILFTVITTLIILSDTLIILWFVIPLFIYYVLFYRQKNLRSNASMIIVCGIGVIAFIVKTLFVDYYVIAPMHLQSPTTIINVNIPLYLNGLLMLYNGSIYQSINGLSGIGILEILFMVFTMLLIYLVYKNHTRDINGKLLLVYTIFFISSVIMLIAYIFTDYAIDIETTRYLIFTGLFFYVLIAVSFNEKSRLYLYFIIALLALLAISNISYVNALDGQPNKEQYGLIDFLQANSLHYGYGNYWTSNVITYLSSENVTIRPINFNDNVKLNDTSKIMAYKWFSNDSWYDYQPDEYFIIIDKDQSIQTQFIAGYTRSHGAYKKLDYENYEIYDFHARPDILISETKSHISQVLQVISKMFSSLTRAV